MRMGRDRDTETVGSPSRRDAWIALAYFGIYLLYLFASLESDPLHWITLVAIPFLVVYVSTPAGSRGFAPVLASFGLRRGNLRRGVGWALILGAAISAFQTLSSNRASEIQDVILSGRAIVLLPLTFLLMMGLAGFTEEFFFRGFLQTRLERLLRARWLAIVLVALLFGVYHLPYAYLNPRWPSAGDWGAAWGAALGNGVPAGLVLGTLYNTSRNNLVACIILHSLINAFPAMTMLRFSGG